MLLILKSITFKKKFECLDIWFFDKENFTLGLYSVRSEWELRNLPPIQSVLLFCVDCCIQLFH